MVKGREGVDDWGGVTGWGVFILQMKHNKILIANKQDQSKAHMLCKYFLIRKSSNKTQMRNWSLISEVNH